MAFKIEHRQWLEEHGVWEQCWRRKEEYKAAGWQPADAQRKALAEFYRPEADTPRATPVRVSAELAD